MHRYRLTIEYDGSQFFGWQRQPDQPTVQGVIEAAVLAFSGESINLQAAGRTDTGVHALGQVAHFDMERQWDGLRIREALNFHLKANRVAIVEAVAVGDDFEARFSATARHYEYRILNRRARSALDYSRVWHIPIPLDHEAMHEAAQSILGLHDFTTFRATQCQAKSPLRTLDGFSVARHGEEIMVTAEARSFLHNQVRSMVGSLRLVGEGKWSPQDFRAALDARERRRCGALAPPHGLYLARVVY